MTKLERRRLVALVKYLRRRSDQTFAKAKRKDKNPITYNFMIAGKSDGILLGAILLEDLIKEFDKHDAKKR